MKSEQIMALIAILLFVLFIAFMVTKKQDNGKKTETKEKSQLSIDTNKTYTAVMKTTEGVIKIEFNAKQTPITVNNFVTLAKKKFYNNTVFHRAIKGFMIQGGDPKGDGTGGPGYRFDDEKFEGEYTRGTIAMANAGPNTNGSQFFIMLADYPLPHNYTIFGRVTAGQEVVDKIGLVKTGANDRPAENVVIKKAVVEQK